LWLRSSARWCSTSAFSGSHSLVDQASATLSGRYTRETMTYIIIGIIARVGGAFTALVARR
jgi:hypothetical protein